MRDEELEEIRSRKLAELQSQAGEEEEQAREAKRSEVLRAYLTPEARERLGRLKLARPDIVMAVEDQIISLVGGGRLDRAIDDETLKKLLMMVNPKRRERKIVFKHK